METNTGNPRYSQDHPGYLGRGEDNAHNGFDAFEIEGEIHLVYNMGSEKEHVSRKSSSEIRGDVDKYLWTPFADFVNPDSK